MDKNLLSLVLALSLTTSSCTSAKRSGSTDMTADSSVDTEIEDGSVADPDSQDTAYLDTEPNIADVAPDTDQGDTLTDSADAADCSVPREGCPCDPDVHTSLCCLDQSHGLECVAFFGTWQSFYDCGCSESSDCEGYPLYQHCEVLY